MTARKAASERYGAPPSSSMATKLIWAGVQQVPLPSPPHVE
eukprot:CAMPEP_0171251834 /NCGR_PEP_ID=MMETSP0790-20130122/50845_1 /TAXON_ID=2925 /ORGANISM="Alexandrium catenella, Strain OF101" /LENGTH=40 /DNA_ID= /DNA_START= /DNA_END= /DNA_ORIENTATION=